jgi:hypothetical protein
MNDPTLRPRESNRNHDRAFNHSFFPVDLLRFASAMSGTESIRPIWQVAIDRYYSQLEEGGMKRTPVIEKDLWAIESPNVLIEEIQQMVPQESTLSNVWMTVLPKVEPMLSSLNDFAAVVAWSLGMNGRVGAILWGSIRLLLKVSNFKAASSPQMADVPAVCTPCFPAIDYDAGSTANSSSEGSSL